MTKWEMVKEIKGIVSAIIAAAIFTIAASGFVMNLVINAKVAAAVTAELSNQNLATDANIVAIKSDVQSNTRTGEENAEDIDQNRERVEAAFAVLLGQ